jgi:hypothetical protein
MRTVVTKHGPRVVESFPATPPFWEWWEGADRPGWLTIRKDARTGAWWVSVWGATESEVRRYCKALAKLLAGALP